MQHITSTYTLLISTNNLDKLCNYVMQFKENKFSWIKSDNLDIEYVCIFNV